MCTIEGWHTATLKSLLEDYIKCIDPWNERLLIPTIFLLLLERGAPCQWKKLLKIPESRLRDYLLPQSQRVLVHFLYTTHLLNFEGRNLEKIWVWGLFVSSVNEILYKLYSYLYIFISLSISASVDAIQQQNENIINKDTFRCLKGINELTWSFGRESVSTHSIFLFV